MAAIDSVQLLATQNGTYTAQWTLAAADTGNALYLPGFADKTVQIVGNFTGGGTVALEGSIDGTTWFQLTDPQGNAISKGANALEAISEAVNYYRPKITGTIVSVVVQLFAKG